MYVRPTAPPGQTTGVYPVTAPSDGCLPPERKAKATSSNRRRRDAGFFWIDRW